MTKHVTSSEIRSPFSAAMAVIQSQATSCPSSVSQAASVEALNGPQDFLKGRRDSFRQRRDLVVSRLNAIDGLECRTPEGAFYTFSGCAGVLGKTTPKGKRLEADQDFTDYLLEEAHGGRKRVLEEVLQDVTAVLQVEVVQQCLDDRLMAGIADRAVVHRPHAAFERLGKRSQSA